MIVAISKRTCKTWIRLSCVINCETIIYCNIKPNIKYSKLYFLREMGQYIRSHEIWSCYHSYENMRRLYAQNSIRQMYMRRSFLAHNVPGHRQCEPKYLQEIKLVRNKVLYYWNPSNRVYSNAGIAHECNKTEFWLSYASDMNEIMLLWSHTFRILQMKLYIHLSIHVLTLNEQGFY